MGLSLPFDKMDSLKKRLLLIWAVSLTIGFAVNQVLPEGIRWKLLLPRWERSSREVAYISVDSAFTLYMNGQVQFVDVRPAEEFEIDHLPGAISLPLMEFFRAPERLEQLDTSRQYMLYCFEPQCEEATSLAGEFTAGKFPHVALLIGGFSAWLERGYPVETE